MLLNCVFPKVTLKQSTIVLDIVVNSDESLRAPLRIVPFLLASLIVMLPAFVGAANASLYFLLAVRPVTVKYNVPVLGRPKLPGK